MKKIFTLVVMTAMTTPAWASAPTASVPEMDAGAGVAAVALLAGVAAIIRERVKNKK